MTKLCLCSLILSPGVPTRRYSNRLIFIRVDAVVLVEKLLLLLLKDLQPLFERHSGLFEVLRALLVHLESLEAAGHVVEEDNLVGRVDEGAEDVPHCVG